MKQLLLALLLSVPALAPAATSEPPGAAAARALAAYRAGDPQPARKTLRVVCWRTRERPFPADYRARLRGILEHIRAFYADEMARHGLGRLTFDLDYDAAGQLVIYEAAGSGTYDDYPKHTSGGKIRDDCVRVLRAAGLDPDRETILLFTNISQWDPAALTFSHHSPYMGSGSSRGGTCWQLDHPALAVSNLTLKAPLIQDGEYGRISLGKHNSIFIGGIAHELGHALGLPHCRATAEEARQWGTALMGAGNRTYGDPLRGEGRGSFLTLASALRLASHPLFSHSARGLEVKAEARFTRLQVAARPGEIDLSGAVSGDVPVYAVLAYFDPEGGGDYDACTAVAAPAADGAFSLSCRDLAPNRAGDLRLVACLANGDTSTVQHGYRVAADGAPDVSAMAVSFGLSDFLSALAAEQFSRAGALRDALPEGSQARRVASAVLAGRTGGPPALAPGAVPASVKSVSLTRLAPAAARVGWGRLGVDHLPRPNALLVAGGELFEHGLFAHAPSSLRYDLTGGGWQRLTGKCGLPVGAGGSVVFIIRTDGREALRTRTLEASRTRAFDIDLAGVRELELVAENGGDNNFSDWSLWLAPELIR